MREWTDERNDVCARWLDNHRNGMLSKVKAIIKFKRNRASVRTHSKSSVDYNSTDDHHRREGNEEDVALVWLGKAIPDPAVIVKLRSIVDFIQVS